MYCGKCGKEIADNSAFCPYCGQQMLAAVPESEAAATAGGAVPEMQPVPPAPKKKSKKRVPIIIISCVLVLALIGGAVWFFIPKKQDFYLAKYESYSSEYTTLCEYDSTYGLVTANYHEKDKNRLINYEYDENGMLSSITYNGKIETLSYSETAEGYVGECDKMKVEYDKDYYLTLWYTKDWDETHIMEHYPNGQKKKEVATCATEVNGTYSESTGIKIISEYNEKGEIISLEEYSGSERITKIAIDNCYQDSYILNLLQGELEVTDGFIVSYKNNEEYGKYEQISENEAELKLFDEDDGEYLRIKMKRDAEEIRYDLYSTDGENVGMILCYFDRYGHLTGEQYTINDEEYSQKFTWEKK